MTKLMNNLPDLQKVSFTESKEVSFISVGTFREIKAIE
jgi:hypothetical protein